MQARSRRPACWLGSDDNSQICLIRARFKIDVAFRSSRRARRCYFSEDASNQAVLCSKKSLHGSPSESVSNPSYSEVRMAQATTLQPGQIRHLFWSVVNN